MFLDKRFITNIVKNITKYGLIPFPGIVGLMFYKKISGFVFADEEIIRDLSLTYFSASLAFLANELKKEINFMNIRKSYGKRILSFNDYTRRVEDNAKEMGIYQKKYSNFNKNLKIKINNNSEYYIDGFIDFIFNPSTSIDRIFFYYSSSGKKYWKTNLEDILLPYKSFFNKVFLNAPAWNELKPRITKIVQEGDSDIILHIEPVPYYYTFIFHYSPDFNLPGKSPNKITIRKIIEPMIIGQEGKFVNLASYEDLPLPATLGVNMLLVTCKDGKIILTKRSPYVAIAPNTYSVSVAGSIDWKTITGTKNPSLKDILFQEILEKEEASPYKELSYILPIGLARLSWVLGEPGIYTIGFADITSHEISKKEISEKGRYKEYIDYKGLSLGKELYICKKQFDTEKICKDIHLIYQKLIEFLNKKYDEVNVNIHATIVLLAGFIYKFCKDDINLDSSIIEIYRKRLIDNG